eukprot:1434441-Pyramimonas_sp.AAC.1
MSAVPLHDPHMTHVGFRLPDPWVSPRCLRNRFSCSYSLCRSSTSSRLYLVVAFGLFRHLAGA